MLSRLLFFFLVKIYVIIIDEGGDGSTLILWNYFTGKLLKEFDLCSMFSDSLSGLESNDLPMFVHQLVFNPSQSIVACTLSRFNAIFILKVSEADDLNVEVFDIIKLDSQPSHIKFAPLSMLTSISAATTPLHPPLFVLTAASRVLFFSIDSELARIAALDFKVFFL